MKGDNRGKNEKTPIVIDDVEYNYEDMTQEQQMFVNHIADLDRKLSSAKFNVDQLEVGKGAFVKMLTDSLIVENNADGNPTGNAPIYNRPGEL